MSNTIIKSSFTRLAALFAVFFITASCADAKKEPVIIKAEGPPPSLVPLPDSLSWGENMFMIPETNTICYPEGGETAAAFLGELLKAASVEAELTKGVNCGNWNLVLNDSLSESLGEEGYRLNIGQDQVTIEGATAAGLLYGVQTLRQIFPAAVEQHRVQKDTVLLRQVQLQDVPRFEWRGTMVDVARSFFGLEYLKEHVDRMSLYKLNRLHLHLTDDQGWRIEIKSRPKLTEIGGNSSVKEGNSGFLTQEEYRELQAYASARNVMIIPEIDMPGHIYAALRSYPELNCEGLANLTPARATPPEPYKEYRVGWSKFCLEDSKTYDFVAEVLAELAAITTGPYIHIGGDEIEDPLYEEFIVKADSIVRGLGKTSIGWEEGTKAEVDPSFISQKWHGRVESVVPDVRIIHSICSQYYFDHANVPGQEFTNNWCKESGVSIEEAYTFASEDPNIIGVEAPVWTEFVINEDRLDDRFWPRSLALAEVGWTPGGKRNYEDFFSRLQGQAERLNQMGINYFETPGIEWNKEDKAEKARSVFSDFMPKHKEYLKP